MKVWRRNIHTNPIHRRKVNHFGGRSRMNLFPDFDGVNVFLSRILSGCGRIRHNWKTRKLIPGGSKVLPAVFAFASRTSSGAEFITFYQFFGLWHMQCFAQSLCFHTSWLSAKSNSIFYFRVCLRLNTCRDYLKDDNHFDPQWNKNEFLKVVNYRKMCI